MLQYIWLKRVIFLVFKDLLKFDKKRQMTIKYGQKNINKQVTEKEMQITNKYE